MPKPSIYTVESEFIPPNKSYRYSSNPGFTIKYNPEDEVMTDWYMDWHTRKNNISFIVYPGDSFVINYDLLDLEAINFYINSRVERREYLEIIPVLWELRKQRLAEMEWENHFVELVASETEKATPEVWQAVEWWKRRVIWKRPIMKDDKKAHRMIKRKLNGAWSGE